jgi:hypothetical protein
MAGASGAAQVIGRLPGHCGAINSVDEIVARLCREWTSQ